MTNVYNAIQNLYNMDKETWQEVLSEMYTLVNNTSLKFDTFEQKFLLHLGNEVTKELKKMYDDGRLGDLINDVLLNDINTKVDNNYTTLDNKIDTVNSELNSQLDTKANKNEIDVSDFGAVNDGIVDNHKAFQDAFNYAKNNGFSKVIIPSGEYNFLKTVNLPNGIDLEGIGNVKIINSITKKLLILPEETIVYPGHGKSTVIKEEKPIYLELRPREDI